MKIYKIKDINPAAYNPRSISDTAFEGLKESIKKFGIVGNFVVNTRNNVLVSGHMRLRACESLGIDEVPVIEVNLSDAEEKALNIALNSQAISGDYTEGLQDLLEEIRFEFDEYEELALDKLEMELAPMELDSDDDREKEKKYILEIQFPSESDMLPVHDDLLRQGYLVKVRG